MRVVFQVFLILLVSIVSRSSVAASYEGSEFVGNYDLVEALSEKGLSCSRFYKQLSIIRNGCVGLTVSNYHKTSPEEIVGSRDNWGEGLTVVHLCNSKLSEKNGSHGGSGYLRGKVDYRGWGDLEYREKTWSTAPIFGIPYDFHPRSFFLRLSSDGRTLVMKVTDKSDSLECRFNKK
ncbi:MAG: hypothetical protein RJB38_1810 [Pseudomonadota bacterium]|jgi:hypothetical protein